MEIRPLQPMDVLELDLAGPIFIASVLYMLTRDGVSTTGKAEFVGRTDDEARNMARNFFANGKVELNIKGELE